MTKKNPLQGYDMEDAMVINRGSLQRGLAYGTVYKSEFVDLKEIVSRTPGVITWKFLFIQKFGQFYQLKCWNL